MRLLVTAGLVWGVWCSAHGQERRTYPYKTTEYVAADGQALPGPEGADYRIERSYRDSLSGVERRYDAKGKLQLSTPYGHMGYRIKLGPQTSFYEGGQLRSKDDYVNDKRDGAFLVYYPDGRVKRRETYTAGERKTAECFAPDGAPATFYEYEVMPTYQGGGTNAVVRAIQGKAKYLVEALRNQEQGQVFVSFRVNPAGEVENVHIAKGVSPSLDRETTAAVKLLKGFEPGRLDGEAVAVSFTVPITFSIR